MFFPLICALWLLSLFFTGSVNAAEPVYRFDWENDIVVQDDGGYTNGFMFSWRYEQEGYSAPQWLQAISRYLPETQDSRFNQRITYQLSHEIYTPDDLESSDLIADDRPYAGLAYWSTQWLSESPQMSNSYTLKIGAVGPITGAELVQKGVHFVTASADPMGWQHQLNNELVFNVENARSYRLSAGTLMRDLAWETRGFSGAKLGTIQSDVSAAIGVNIGQGLASGWRWLLYVNVGARYVFNDITLDGNYFSESHSVTLIPQRLEANVGALMESNRYQLGFSLFETTQNFEEREEDSAFGTFTFAFKF